MIDGLTTLLEKLPTFAARSGFILAVVGGTLQLGIRFGLIETTALNGYVAQAAPVMGLAGAGMVAASLVIAALRWMASWRGAISNWRQRRENARRLEENLRFLDPHALLFLLIILKMPRGRIPGGGHPSVERMQELDLLVVEASGNWVMGRPATLRLAPEIFDQRKRLTAGLETELSRYFSEDVSDPDVLARLVQEHRRREGFV